MEKNMFRTVLVLAIIFLFVLTSVIPSIANPIIDKKINHPISYGKTIYVGGTEEGNYTMIQDAINNASNGDSVFVYDDSSPYFENIIINKSINLIGEDKDTTIIDGSDSGEVVKVFADQVNISGFTIQNSQYGYYTGLFISSSFNYINNNIITSNNGSGIFFAGGFFSPVCCNVISGNIISSNKKYGICIESSGNNTINDNIIVSNYFDGIYLSNSISNTIIGNTILNNSNGINIHDSNSITITGNNISNNTNGIHLEGSSSNIINSNNIISNSYDGINLYDSSSNTINDNNISNNENGIYLHASDFNKISCNTITDNKRGIYISNFDIISGDENPSTFNIINGNNIYNNDLGIFFYLSSFNFILRNNFLGNKRHASFRLCRNIWMLNYWNRPRILPKLIFGRINRPRIFPKIIFGRIGLFSLIPGVNIDWRPALRPNDI